MPLLAAPAWAAPPLSENLPSPPTAGTPVPGAAAPVTPADCWAVAAADAARDPANSLYYRYGGLWGVPEAQWDWWRRVLSLHTNGLSTEPELTTPALVVGQQAAGRRAAVLRWDTRDYGPAFARSWEKLAQFDPFLHVRLVPSVAHTETAYRPTGVYAGRETTYDERDNSWYFTYNSRTGQRQIAATYERRLQGGDDNKGKLAYSPILSETPAQRAAVKVLVEATHSPAALVYAPWFLFQTAIQQDRSPAGYADFLGFKDQDEYEKLIGFDPKALEQFPLEFAEAVALGGPTVRKKPRAIVGFGKIQGVYLKTLDVNVPTDRANPLRVFDPQHYLDFAAIETLGPLPNGLLAAGLFNGKGVRQDFAPQAIVLDALGDQGDLNVHLGAVSCLRCHDTNGIADVRGYVRTVLARPPLAYNLSLFKGVSEAEYRRLRRIYYAETLQQFLEDDRRIVGRAVTAATGWEPQKAISAYVKAWEQYRKPVTAERAAAELGVTKAEMLEGFGRYLRATNSIDPVLAAYVPVTDPAEVKRLGGVLGELTAGGAVQREVFHEVYPLAQYAIRGIVVPPVVEEVRR